MKKMRYATCVTKPIRKRREVSDNEFLYLFYYVWTIFGIDGCCTLVRNCRR